MTNLNLLLIILCIMIVTVFLRTIPIFFKIPENNMFIKKFFEGLPFVALTILVFPDILTSIGTKGFEIFIAIAGIITVTILTLKKFNLTLIVILSTTVVTLLNICFNKFL